MFVNVECISENTQFGVLRDIYVDATGTAYATDLINNVALEGVVRTFEIMKITSILSA